MEPKDMGAMDPTWLQAIHPRGSAAGEGCVKGAFQYNGGHGLTTFFVYVELAEPLRQQLAGQGLDPVDTVALANRMQSASISMALKATPVSVEKYGCPVPPAKNTTLPCLKYLLALSLEKSLVIAPTANGVRISVSMPVLLKISET